jgi:ribosomal protein S18 acetylase RimI-like enzyme
MPNQSNTLPDTRQVHTPAHTEPAQLGQAPLTMRRIADAQSTDFPALVALIVANPRYRLETQQRRSTRDDALSIVNDLPPHAKAAQKYVWGVWHGKVLIGCLEVVRHWPQAHHLYIGQLTVAERWQRQGHGQAVMAMLAERSRSWPGVRRWRLAVVASQAGAIAFWRRLGFSDTGQRETSPAYRVPLVVMEKVVGR